MKEPAPRAKTATFLSRYGEEGRPLEEKGRVMYFANVDGYTSSTPTPEDLLLEREEGESEDGRRRARLSSERLGALLERLPPDERELLVAYYSGAQTQRQMAARLGVSQPSVVEILRYAVRRLRWLAGSGAAFTPEELERDLEGHVPPLELSALIIYWRTTSKRRVQLELGLERDESEALLERAMAALSGRHKRAFDELQRPEWTNILVDKRVKRRALLSAVEDFVDNGLVFERYARTPSITLRIAYERHALSMGRSTGPVRGPRSLWPFLYARGARRCWMRVPWESRCVPALIGVRLLHERRCPAP